MQKIPQSTIPKWFWNTDEITKEEIYYQFKGFRDEDGYNGVMIVLWDNEGYMEEDFFIKYKWALESAKELGLKIIIWDENAFPSGHAGGLFEQRYPK